MVQHVLPPWEPNPNPNLKFANTREAHVLGCLSCQGGVEGYMWCWRDMLSGWVMEGGGTRHLFMMRGVGLRHTATTTEDRNTAAFFYSDFLWVRNKLLPHVVAATLAIGNSF